MAVTAASMLSKPFTDAADLLADCDTWRKWTQSFGSADARRRIFFHEPNLDTEGFPPPNNLPFAVVGIGEQAVGRGGYYKGSVRIRFVARVATIYHKDGASLNRHDDDRISPVVSLLNAVGDILGEMWTLSENGGYQIIQDPINVTTVQRNPTEENDDTLDVMIEYQAGTR